MSETKLIRVPVGIWTDVTGSAIKGFITNFSQHEMRYRIADTQPDSVDTFGHIINPQEKRWFDVEGTTRRVWAYGFYIDAVIALTEDHDAPVLTVPKMSDYLIEVRKGNIPGARSIVQRGYNPEIDTAAVEDIRWQGGTHTPLITAVQLSIVSTSAADTNNTGANAWTIEIFGLDQNFNEISEVVALNGTTPVTTTQAFLRFNLAIVRNVGTYNVTNAGDINISANAVIELVIPANVGTSRDSRRTIPAGKTGFLLSVITTNIDNVNDLAGIYLKGRPNIIPIPTTPPYSGIFEFEPHVGVRGENQLFSSTSRVLPAGTDVWAVGEAVSNNAFIGIIYEILLLDNP